MMSALLLSVFFSFWPYLAVATKPYDPMGGAQYLTTHSSPTPLLAEVHQYEAFPDEDIKEWHFHVYFFQNNDQSVADAMRLKAEIVENVRQGKFLAVCDGVDANVTKAGFGLDFDSTLVPEVNMGPRGPHPAGSYEVWVPVEHVGALISYLTLHRGEVSLLFHPLTKHCIEDHTGRIMFMGPSFNIDRTVLDENDDECDGSQYPELGLGYSRR